MSATKQLSLNIGHEAGDNFLSRAAVKDRLVSTTLLPADPLFHLEKWVAGDEKETISWQVNPTESGEVLVAATGKGVCFLGFTSGTHKEVLADLRMRFPQNALAEKSTTWLEEVREWINHPLQKMPVHLHLKGTDFQMGIWEKLLRIPFGGLVTYSDLGNGAKSARATGSAVGANPVSIVVPCHRVVRADGTYDGYYWGPVIKKKLLAYEAALASENVKS